MPRIYSLWMGGCLCAWLFAGKAIAADDLSEVLVTASRYQRPILQYGGSATRLSQDDIERRGATHYAEVLNTVPGVFLQRGSGQEGLLAIRSPVLTGAGACGAFLLLEDGLPVRPTGFCNVNELFEINTEQAGAIEVLRGPGSATYGANALHGIVNVLGRTAGSLGQPRIGLRIGNEDFQQAAFEWSDRSASETAVTAHGFWRHDGGFRAASGSDETKLNVALARERDRHSWQWRSSATLLNQETAGFIRGRDSYRDRSLSRANPNPEAFRDAYALRSSLQYRDTPCPACETTAYALLRSSSMEFLQHFLLGKPLEENDQRSVGFGASWRKPWGSRGQWQLGVDGGAMQMSLRETQSGPTLEGSPAARAIRPAGQHYHYGVDGLTAAASGTVEWPLATRHALAIQSRIEWLEYRYDNRMLSGNTTESGAICAFGGCLFSRPDDRTDRFIDGAARLEWRYTPVDGGLLYAHVARGFRPPETTEMYRLQRGQASAQLGVENLQGVEAGWRQRQGVWRWALGVYAQEKRNVLLRDANGFNVDGGRTRHAGLEYELAYSPNEQFFAELTGSYARHRYAFNRVIEGGEIVVSGRDIDTAPRQLMGLQFTWKSRSDWRFSTQIQHTGRYFVDASAVNSYPGHTLAAVSIASPQRGGWQWRLHGENILDTRYADRADFAQGEYRYFPGQRRLMLLELSWSNPAATEE